LSAQHTPGPWGVAEAAPDDKMMRVGSNLDPNTEITKNGGMRIAQVIGPDRIANARLIAAAPDLLAALKDLLGDNRLHGNLNDETGHCVTCGRDNSGHETEPCSDDCPAEIARAAIAKATT
jgi:hypothetical protein